MDSVFPELTEDLLDQVVDMEMVTQSDDAWKEGPAMVVLLAIEVLKMFYSREHQQDVVVAMAKETIYHFANWRNSDLDISSDVRKEMYQRNYKGEPWEEYYHEDGF